MSRTDKDRPFWVKLNDPSENRTDDHMHHTRGLWSKDWDGVCDIDKPYGPTLKRWAGRNCHRMIHNYNPWDDPTKEDRDLLYYGPLRASERDTLKKAAKEYNTTGDTEDVFLQEKHRHSMFGGGYWN